MTANEMFEEIGYEQSSIDMDDKDTLVRYIKDAGPECHTITVYAWGVEAEVSDLRINYTHAVAFTVKEIKAVAKLLEEMEEHEQASIIE